MRILIAEDETATANFVREVLEDAGHEVVGVVADEATAWHHATTGVDLALIDLHLADGITGAHLAHDLREMFGVRSIFISGYQADCRLRAKDSLALGCLLKPFTEDDLVSTVSIAFRLLRGSCRTTRLHNWSYTDTWSKDARLEGTPRPGMREVVLSRNRRPRTYNQFGDAE